MIKADCRKTNYHFTLHSGETGVSNFCFVIFNKIIFATCLLVLKKRSLVFSLIKLNSFSLQISAKRYSSDIVIMFYMDFKIFFLFKSNINQKYIFWNYVVSIHTYWTEVTFGIQIHQEF